MRTQLRMEHLRRETRNTVRLGPSLGNYPLAAASAQGGGESRSVRFPREQEELMMPGHVYAPNVDLDQDELAAIEQVSRSYWEAWYAGDVELMERCLHPDLDKRTLAHLILDTRAKLITSDVTTRSAMLELTEAGIGRAEREDQRIEITVLGALHYLASVKASGNGMTDLLHLMKFPEGWRIIHSVWTLDGGVIANATYDA